MPPKRSSLKKLVTRKDLETGTILCEAREWKGDLGPTTITGFHAKVRGAYSVKEKLDRETVAHQWLGYFVCKSNDRAYSYACIVEENVDTETQEKTCVKNCGPLPMKNFNLAWRFSKARQAEILALVQNQPDLEEGADPLSWENLQHLGLTVKTPRGLIPVADTRYLMQLCPAAAGESGPGSDKRSAISSIAADLIEFDANFEISLEDSEQFDACQALLGLDRAIWESHTWEEIAGKSPPSMKPRDWIGMPELYLPISEQPGQPKAHIESLIHKIALRYRENKKKTPKATKRKTETKLTAGAAKKQKRAAKKAAKKQKKAEKRAFKEALKKVPPSSPPTKKKAPPPPPPAKAPAPKRKRIPPKAPSAPNKRARTDYELRTDSTLLGTLSATREAFVQAGRWDKIENVLDLQALDGADPKTRWKTLTRILTKKFGRSKARIYGKLMLSMVPNMFQKKKKESDGFDPFGAFDDEEQSEEEASAPPPPRFDNPLAATLLDTYHQFASAHSGKVKVMVSEWDLDKYTEPETLFTKDAPDVGGLTERERRDFLLHTYGKIFPRPTQVKRGLVATIAKIY